MERHPSSERCLLVALAVLAIWWAGGTSEASAEEISTGGLFVSMTIQMPDQTQVTVATGMGKTASVQSIDDQSGYFIGFRPTEANTRAGTVDIDVLLLEEVNGEPVEIHRLTTALGTVGREVTLAHGPSAVVTVDAVGGLEDLGLDMVRRACAEPTRESPIGRWGTLFPCCTSCGSVQVCGCAVSASCGSCCGTCCTY